MTRALLILFLSLFARSLGAADSRIWINATINGQSVRLVFDTGATHSALSREAVERLRVKMSDSTMKSRTGSAIAAISEPVDFSYGDLKVKMEFLVLPTPPADVSTDEMDGFLSWFPFKDNVLIFSAVTQKAEITDKLPERAEAWSRFKQIDDRLLGFELPDRNSPHSAIYIDTGSYEGAALHLTLWKKLAAMQTNQPVTMVGNYVPAAGMFFSQTMWADQIVFGPLMLKDIPVRPVHDRESWAAVTNHAATLGLFGLRRLDIVVDGKNRLIYANPKSDLPPEYEHNRVGALFAPREENSNDPLVAQVAPNSPASRAGIQNDDALLKIGDLDVTKWRTDPRVMPIRRFWEDKPGTKLNLTLKRGEKEYRTTVVLEDILAPGVTGMRRK